MFVPLGEFGRHGVVADTMAAVLPVGVWSDARNIRFSGVQMEKMLEPEVFAAMVDALAAPLPDQEWMQGWSDGLSTYIVAATREKLYYFKRSSAIDTGEWFDATRLTGDYSAEGLWSSFSWGDTCIFNNQVDPPQIFNPSTLKFEDLPRWGAISSAADISANAEPTNIVSVACTILRPYKNFLVACGITEAGEYQPNAIWWSDATALAAYSTRVGDGGPPSWDYQSPSTLSGKTEVGIGNGAITCAAALNENMVIYTERSATSMQQVGGNLVMSFRRLFEKGAAALHSVVEYNNQHFVVSRDQIYIHNGSAVKLVAKDRIEEEFFRRAGKGGRFGDGTIEWDRVQVVKNPDRKEIYVIFGDWAATVSGGGSGPGGTGPGESLPAPFTHVCGLTPSGGQSQITATTILEITDGLGSPRADGPQGMFHVNGSDIIAHAGADNAVISRNFGVDWTDPFALGGGTDFTGKFGFNPALTLTGTWYVHREDANSFSGIWYSENEGATWTLMGGKDNLNTGSSCMEVDLRDGPTNGFVFGAHVTKAYAWTQTTGDFPVVNPQWNYENLAWGSNADNLALIGDYFVSSREELNPAARYLRLMLTGETEAEFESGVITSYPTQFTTDADFQPWSKTYQDRCVFAVIDQGVDVGLGDRSLTQIHVIDPVKMVLAGEAAEPAIITVEFEEPVDCVRINVADNYFLAIARPYAQDVTSDLRLLAKWASDEVNPVWSEKIEIIIPDVTGTSGLTGRLHVEWASGHKWVIGYLKDADQSQRLVVVDLCIGEVA